MTIIVRKELEADRGDIFAINQLAFETSDEAKLVDRLRKEASPIISLVAEDDGKVVGHIMFSPATFSGHEDVKIMGLAPMAITPEQQNKGIGSKLVKIGLEQCKEMGVKAVVVLGHPNYYPRFGFKSSVLYGIKSEYDVPDDVFMVMELETDVFKGRAGIVKYHKAFAEL